MKARTDIAVVVPTFERPDWLTRALRSLAEQVLLPRVVVAVCRDTDVPTHDAISRAQAIHGTHFKVMKRVVAIPGHMPPVAQGLREGAKWTPVVAVLDDDAEAEPDWLQRLLAGFSDPTVGAVGGRYVNMVGNLPASVPVRSVFGKVDYWGRFVGNLYCDPDSEGTRDVDFLIGGNMAYRSQVIERLEFDLRLNAGVAFNYEVDLGLQVKAMGYRVLFDPLARVRHYSAPRASAGMRRPDAASVRDYARNQVLIAGKRLSAAKRLRALLFYLLVGDRTALSIGSALVDTLVTGSLGWHGAFLGSLEGKLEALRFLLSDLRYALLSRLQKTLRRR